MSSATVDTRDTQEFDARCASWIQQMSRGSEEALGDLYEATLSRVFGVAVRIVGDSDVAEDVATEVYYEAWKKAGQYDAARGRPLTWLLAICRNRALDEYRRMASASRTVESAAALEVAEEVQEPDDVLAAVEEGHVVQVLLAGVEAEDRQLLALAFFKGMSHSQIAEHVGQPLGTVKSRIRRTLSALGEAVPAGVRY